MVCKTGQYLLFYYSIHCQQTHYHAKHSTKDLYITTSLTLRTVLDHQCMDGRLAESLFVFINQLLFNLNLKS